MAAELHLFKRIWQSIGLVSSMVIAIPTPTKPRPDPDLARGVWAEGAALPLAASSGFGNGAARLCSAPGLV